MTKKKINWAWFRHKINTNNKLKGLFGWKNARFGLIIT